MLPTCSCRWGAFSVLTLDFLLIKQYVLAGGCDRTSASRRPVQPYLHGCTVQEQPTKGVCYVNAAKLPSWTSISGLPNMDPEVDRIDSADSGGLGRLEEAYPCFRGVLTRETYGRSLS